MSMLHGKVIVEAPDDGDGPAGEDSEKLSEGEGDRRRRPVTDRACAHFSLLGSLTSLPTRVADIEASTRRHPGTEKVEVNQGSGRVALSYDAAQTSVEELRDHLAKASGFDVADRPDPGSAQTENAEDAARAAEVRDLSWRVAAGAVLTVPVLYAAMVGHFLGEHLVPDLLTALTERR